MKENEKSKQTKEIECVQVRAFDFNAEREGKRNGETKKKKRVDAKGETFSNAITTCGVFVFKQTHHRPFNSQSVTH